MLGQMLEIYGLAPNNIIKRGQAPFLLDMCLGQSIQHLAKHVFPAFGLAYVSCIWPSIYFLRLA